MHGETIFALLFVVAVPCLAASGASVCQPAWTEPSGLWVLAAMVALAVTIGGIYRLTKREIRLHE